jgi:L-lactate dehydrogenase complex protein LldG
MSARDEMFSAIRNRRLKSVPRPPPWRMSQRPNDLVGHFTERASAAAAQVKHLGSTREIAASVADILRARNMPAILHMPPDATLERLTWDDAPGLTLARTAPGPDDAAMSFARFAIAETGTLVYPASPARPASWHFRPGLEIAVVGEDSILFDLERALARLRADGSQPSTLNLVTGPSRTGDIEQTLELGAHGPKELVILVVPSLGGSGQI